MWSLSMSEIERCLYCGVRRLFFLISFSIVHVLSLTELNLGRVNEIKLRKVQTIPGSKPSLPRLVRHASWNPYPTQWGKGKKAMKQKQKSESDESRNKRPRLLWTLHVIPQWHTICLCNRCNLMVNVLSVFTVFLLCRGILRDSLPADVPTNEPQRTSAGRLISGEGERNKMECSWYSSTRKFYLFHYSTSYIPIPKCHYQVIIHYY